MCGIAGILNLVDSEKVDSNRLKRMCSVIRHRGPDDNGIILTNRVGLGHLRLSIIDLKGGHQPMVNQSRNIWITYNGEIYNYKELRKELIVRGYNFVTNSDTEVILRAYEAFGEDCVSRLRGMFAFAIWDQKRNKLFFARDRLGIKPLYYSINNKELLFGSEIKAILAAKSGDTKFNTEILPEFLATRFVAGEDTFFSGIKKLLPGHTLSWTPEGGFKMNQYWTLPAIQSPTDETFVERADEVRIRLEESLSKHLISDVPVGLFLSGGIDSSGLAALMSKMVNGPVPTFSVGFSENIFSELNYAELVADAIGAKSRHRQVKISASQFFQALPKLIWHEDEPIAFPSSISLYFVSKLARRSGIKVVLSGEGADELFLGYNRYRVTAWNDRLGRTYNSLMPGLFRSGLRSLIGKMPNSVNRYASRSFLSLDCSPRELFFENFATFPTLMQLDLLQNPDLLVNRDQFGTELKYFGESQSGILEKMAYTDMKTYLVELLMKQDQMSMAASIESRVPFLDHKFVEYAYSIPGRYKLRGLKTKAVLRKALHDVLPAEILKRPKMGFPTPIGQWLRGSYRSLIEKYILGPRPMARGIFHPYALRNLVQEHLDGKRDHGERLWLLINLEIWQRIFIEGEVPDSIRGENDDFKKFLTIPRRMVSSSNAIPQASVQ